MIEFCSTRRFLRLWLISGSPSAPAFIAVVEGETSSLSLAFNRAKESSDDGWRDPLLQRAAQNLRVRLKSGSDKEPASSAGCIRSKVILDRSPTTRVIVPAKFGLGV